MMIGFHVDENEELQLPDPHSVRQIGLGRSLLTDAPQDGISAVDHGNGLNRQPSASEQKDDGDDQWINESK